MRRRDFGEGGPAESDISSMAPAVRASASDLVEQIKIRTLSRTDPAPQYRPRNAGGGCVIQVPHHWALPGEAGRMRRRDFGEGGPAESRISSTAPGRRASGAELVKQIKDRTFHELTLLRVKKLPFGTVNQRTKFAQGDRPQHVRSLCQGQRLSKAVRQMAVVYRPRSTVCGLPWFTIMPRAVPVLCGKPRPLPGLLAGRCRRKHAAAGWVSQRRYHIITH